jgi:alpha-ribazole phosphatase
MQIYLIRHPPPIGVDGLCYGRLDVAVQREAVIAAAESLSRRLAMLTLAGAPIYCSPASRCVALARHIAAPRQPTPAEDLMEMNFGRWQGLRWDAIARDEIDAWAKDVWNYRPGGGESAQMVAVRWDRWVQQMRQTHDGDVLAVTHAGVIRVALARSGASSGSGAAPGSPALEAHIPFGSIHSLDLC